MKYENMTWLDLVRKYFPNADDLLCDFILWEKTSFPMDIPENIEKQLKKLIGEGMKNSESK